MTIGDTRDDLITEGKVLTREEMDRVIAALDDLPSIGRGRVVEIPWSSFDPLDPTTWSR